VAASAVAGEKRSDALLIFAASAMLTGVATLTARIPAAEVGLLDREPCVRFDVFLPGDVAAELEAEVRRGLVYERVELGSLTSQWRARRPLGDGYFGPMLRRPGWSSPASVVAAVEMFESAAFTRWLSDLAGEEVRFLRPATAYRLDRGDRICLHDDMSDPEHAVSVAYNLSREWTASDGGQTVFGDVIGVTPVDTPADAPFPLQQWHVRDERVFVPVFNSMLVMRLGARFAHGVSEVTSERSRLSLVAIYGRR